MSEKRFYQSKKFVYAVSGFSASLIVALLPSVFTLDPQTLDQLKIVLPGVLAFFGFVLAGHQWMDARSLALQAPPLEEITEVQPPAERAPDA
jgi:hypothetical protein